MQTFKAKYWWLLLIRGLILIVIGVIAFRHPMASLLGLALYFGIATLFSGVSMLMLSISNRNQMENWGWYMASAIIDLIFGFILLSHPGITATILPFILGFWIIFSGVIELFNSFQLKKEKVANWWTGLLGGIISIILGYFILRNPLAGVLTITYLLGFILIIAGVVNIYLSAALKKGVPQSEE